MVEFMRNIHEEVKKKIEVSNVIYKVVAVKHKKHLTFKRLKLQERKRFFFFLNNERKVSPCQVLQKVNDNAYQVQLPPHLQHLQCPTSFALSCLNGLPHQHCKREGPDAVHHFVLLASCSLKIFCNL